MYDLVNPDSEIEKIFLTLTLHRTLAAISQFSEIDFWEVIPFTI